VKRVLLGLLLLVAGIAAVVVIRAATLPSRQVETEPAPAYAVDGKRLAQRLALAIRLQTISHQDRSEMDPRPFRNLAGLLRAQHPAVHRRLSVEKVNDLSLLYTWQGRNPDLPPVLLAAHTDVVPVDPASLGDWKHPPYEGVIEAGVVWGRGAVDDKVSVITIMEAVERLIVDGFEPERTVYLAFGHDEEVGGDEGALAMAKLLQSRGVRLEWVLDEGGVIAAGMVPGIETQVAVVGVAEKGSVSIGMKVEAAGGHSSTPPDHTAIGVLARAIVRLEENQMPADIDGVTAGFLDALAPELPFTARLVLANRWLFGGLIRWGFLREPALAAMIRTTTAATMMESGVKENVIPVEANAIVNFRIHPRDRVEDVVEHVRRTIDDDDILLRRGVRSEPREPSPISPVESGAFATLERTIRSVFPDVIVVPYLVPGGTDARHYHPLTANVYRFGPYVMGKGTIESVHGTDERIDQTNLLRGVRFYRQLLIDGAGAAVPGGGNGAQSSSE
jgi:carboxypeptidase PM20D1